MANDVDNATVIKQSGSLSDIIPTNPDSSALPIVIQGFNISNLNIREKVTIFMYIHLV